MEDDSRLDAHLQSAEGGGVAIQVDRHRRLVVVQLERVEPEPPALEQLAEQLLHALAGPGGDHGRRAVRQQDLDQRDRAARVLNLERLVAELGRDRVPRSGAPHHELLLVVGAVLLVFVRPAARAAQSVLLFARLPHIELAPVLYENKPQGRIIIRRKRM